MTVALVGPDAGAAPRARAVRRWTTATANAHGGARLGEVLGDVYYTLISSAIGFALALGVAEELRVSLPDPPAEAGVGSASLAPGVSWVLLAGLGVVLSLAARLGPVGVGGAEATWLLGLPVDRRGLVRPAARRLPMLAALVAAVVVGVLDAGLLADRDVGHILRAAAGGALGCAVVVLVAGLAQTLQAPRRAVAGVGDAVLAVVPVLALLTVLRGWPSPSLLAVSAPVLVGLVALVAGFGWAVDSRLRKLPARSLRESGSVTSQAAGALVSMDSRELGRALTDSAAQVRRRRARRFRVVHGPVGALVLADVLVLVRSPRHLVQIAVAALVPVLVAQTPQLAGPVGFVLALLVAGAVAASAVAEGARRAEMSPALDRLLPLDAKMARRLRLVVPVSALLGWSVVAFGAVGLWSGSLLPWLALGVAATPVWAAAAVRAAFRPAPDWGGPLVSTPMGALPGGVASVLARGPDVVVLGLVPTIVALVLDQVTPAVVGFQLAFAAIAVLVASGTDTRPLLERLTDPERVVGR
jgi:hypothetical protein